MSDRQKPTHPAERTYDDAEVRRILSRATELEVYGVSSRLTEQEIREIAAAAGIDAEAVSAALAEYEPRGSAGPDASGIPWKDLLIPIGVGYGAIGLGLVARALRPLMNAGGVHVEAVIALVLVVGTLLAIALEGSDRSSQLRFHLSNVLAWCGLTLGWSVMHGGLWQDVVMVFAGWMVGSGIVGSLIVHLMDRRRGRRATPGSGAAPDGNGALDEAPGGSRRRRGLLRRCWEWVMGLVRVRPAMTVHSKVVPRG